MSEEYLWDPQQKPDRGVEDLERALGQLRYQPDPQKFQRRLGTKGPSLQWRWLAAAAAVLLAIAGGSWYVWERTQRPGWRIASAKGSVQLNGGVTLGAKGGLFGEGQILRTGESGRAVLEVGLLGLVEVGEGSTVRLLKADAREQRLALDRGTIEAMISAPPRLFVVETPSAVATDLGCAYALEVGEDGRGLLRVKVGWVSFEALGRESFIPAGAASHTRKGYAPGTPFFIDAPAALQDELMEVDFNPDASRRLQARQAVMREARARDGLTLWHLLSRGTEQERALAYDTLAKLVRLPEGVSREAVLRLERSELDRIWNALNLGPTTWWRRWRGPGLPQVEGLTPRPPAR